MQFLGRIPSGLRYGASFYRFWHHCHSFAQKRALIRRWRAL